MKYTIRQLAASLLLSLAASSSQALTSSPEINAFAEEMAKKHGFESSQITRLLSQAKFRDDIIRAISRPAESKAWHEYRPIFLTEDRIRGGISFWRQNQALLEQVSREYGVPPEIIVAIIGVETRFGRHTGRYRVLDALTTLAFGYPKRSKFFRSELEQFLLLSREEQISPTASKGSYAGAMGMPQFISSSYRTYAVDHDKDGRRDLWNNKADVIASVANYFKRHGWRAGEPIALRVRGGSKVHEKYVERGMKPVTPVTELLASGLKAEQAPQLTGDALGSLIRLDAGEEDEYWVGLHNFYVITRYNHSNLYAMATYQLSRAIKRAKEARERAPLD